ncbi:acyltransferase family protein [Alteromonas sp. A081]|uniref:acyltransferase family protein n=1 Tax=Alteromonas sp. A081 TaxID=3410269 RepID=UPI003B984CE7
MTFVHINPGTSTWSTRTDVNGYSVMIFFIDVLGRASVPALSVISGFLLVHSARKNSKWPSHIKSKFKKLVVPLICWNIIIVVFSLMVFYITSVKTSQMRDLVSEPLTILRCIDLLTGINYNSITEPLNFLRDIFVCSIVSPLLIYFCRRNKEAFVVLVWLICLNYDIKPLIMRDSILMFFSIGIALATSGSSLFKLDENKLNILLASLISVLFSFYIMESITIQLLTEIVFRLIIALLFIVSSFYIASIFSLNNSRKIGQYSFPLYLSHSILFSVQWGIWQTLFEKEVSDNYIIFFSIVPCSTVLFVILLYKTQKISLPSFSRFLWGK